MNLTTTNIGLEDDQARIKKVKLNHFTVRGGPTYINWLQLNTRTISIATTFSSLSLALSLSPSLSLSLFFFSWRVFHLKYLPLNHLYTTLVDHLSPYLSTCPIRHLFWFSMSYDSQDNTV